MEWNRIGGRSEVVFNGVVAQLNVGAEHFAARHCRRITRGNALGLRQPERRRAIQPPALNQSIDLLVLQCPGGELPTDQRQSLAENTISRHIAEGAVTRGPSRSRAAVTAGAVIGGSRRSAPTVRHEVIGCWSPPLLNLTN